MALYQGTAEWKAWEAQRVKNQEADDIAIVTEWVDHPTGHHTYGFWEHRSLAAFNRIGEDFMVSALPICFVFWIICKLIDGWFE